MRTTVDIADSIYRQVKARAALRGQTVRAFLLEAINEKLSAENAPTSGPAGWRSVFGKAARRSIEDLQKEIDREFSRIDPEDWK